MASRGSYRELVAWQRARQLAVTVYRLSERFPGAEQFALTNQARRAAISVLSNIAEGAGRGGDREFRQFLYLSRGSLAELESQLLVASDLRYLPDDHPVFAECAEVGRVLNGLITSLTRKMSAE